MESVFDSKMSAMSDINKLNDVSGVEHPDHLHQAAWEIERDMIKTKPKRITFNDDKRRKLVQEFPEYDPTVSKLEIYRKIEDMVEHGETNDRIEMLMIINNYPKHFIQDVLSEKFAAKRLPQLKRMESNKLERIEDNNRQFGGYRDLPGRGKIRKMVNFPSGKGSKKQSVVWEVPYKKFRNDNPQIFQNNSTEVEIIKLLKERWINVLFRYLVARRCYQIEHLLGNVKKRVITCSLTTQQLWYTVVYNGSRADMVDMLNKVHVYTEEYDYVEKHAHLTHSKIHKTEIFEKTSLWILGREYRTLEAFLECEFLFKKHKPLLKFCKQFFQDPKSVNAHQLQDQLNKNFSDVSKVKMQGNDDDQPSYAFKVSGVYLDYKELQEASENFQVFIEAHSAILGLDLRSDSHAFYYKYRSEFFMHLNPLFLRDRDMRSYLLLNVDKENLVDEIIGVRKNLRAKIPDIDQSSYFVQIVGRHYALNYLEIAKLRLIPVYRRQVSAQGQGISVNVQHKHSLPAQQELDGLVAAIAGNVSNRVGNDIARRISSVVSFIISLYCARSITAVMAIVSQFVSSDPTLFKFCSGSLSQLAGMQRSIVEAQGADEKSEEQEFAEKINDTKNANNLDEKEMSYWEQLKESFSSFTDLIYQTIVGGGVILIMKEVLGDIVESISEALMLLVKSIKFSFLKEGGQMIAKMVINSITEVIDKMKTCWELKSFHPLFGDNFDPKKWNVRASGVLIHYRLMTCNEHTDPLAIERLNELRDKGEISSDWIAPVGCPVFVERVRTIIEDGHRLRKLFKNSINLVRDISIIIAKLDSLITSILQTNLSSTARVPPYFIYIYGVPHTGKTSLVDIILKSVARKFRYATNYGVYQLKVNENFHTGLCETTWAVVANDVDISPQPNPTIPSDVEFDMHMVDSSPFRVEAAKVEDKGTITTCPIIYIKTSNFRDSRVRKKLLTPEAWFRRIGDYIVLEADDKYAITGTVKIDPVKAANADTNDVYKIKCHSFNFKSKPFTDFPFNFEGEFSTTDYIKRLMTKLEDHIASHSKTIAKRSVYGDYCKLCFMDIGKCSCEQGFDEVVYDIKERFSPISNKIYNGIDYVRNALGSTIDESKILSSFNQRVTDFTNDFFKDPSLILKIGGVIAALKGIHLIVSSYYRKPEPQGRDNLLVEGENPQGWFRLPQLFSPGVVPPKFKATFTKDELIKAIQDSFVIVKGNGKIVNGILISHNLVLTVSHIIEGDSIDSHPSLDRNSVVRIVIPKHNREISITISSVTAKFLPSAQNLLVIKVSEALPTTKMVGKFWKFPTKMIQSFDKVELVRPNDVMIANSNRIMKGKFGVDLTLTTPLNTINGDCGSIYIAEFDGCWLAVGSHFALLSNHRVITGEVESYTLGGIVSGYELICVAENLATTMQSLSTPLSFYSKDNRPVIATTMPAKSEIQAAISLHDAEVYCLGTLDPKLHLTNMKTNVKQALTNHHFKQVIDEWCGTPDYWRIPTKEQLHGKMGSDGKWYSAYTNMFKTQNKTSFSDPLMWYCVADYLHDIDTLDNSGYRELSDNEAVVGVPNTIIHSINLNTSAGPPLNESKYKHYCTNNHLGSISPAVNEMMNEIENNLDAGVITSPIGLCIPKDEALKWDKDFPRIFTNVASAFNIHIKKYSGAIKTFMRKNMTFFGSMVGMNITSVEATHFIQQLMQIDPSLENLSDLDAKSLDKSFNGKWCEFVSYVLYAIAFHLGLRAMRLMTLLYGAKYVQYCVKNDLFFAFLNASGWDFTVEFNDILMQLGNRYVYYFEIFQGKELPSWISEYCKNFFKDPIPKKEWFPGNSSYRYKRKLMTFGDDCGMARKPGDRISDDYLRVWKDELGIIITSGSKDDSLRDLNVSEIVFLKRNFVFDKELNQYLTPLSLKSIARMLAIKKDSELSLRDHACVALSEVYRELCYHPRRIYDKFDALVRGFLIEHDLLSNPYFKRTDFDLARQDIKEGTYQTWFARNPVEYVKLGDEFTF